MATKQRCDAEPRAADHGMLVNLVEDFHGEERTGAFRPKQAETIVDERKIKHRGCGTI